MSIWNRSVAASVLLVIFGCNESTPGGPGAKTENGGERQTVGKPVLGESKETFTLKTPILATSIRQGETKTATIAINRGTDFNDDVKLSFTNVPKGVMLDPENAMIRHGDQDFKLNITVAEDASLGDFTVKVVGHPMQNGADATSEFKMAISAK